MYRYNDTTLRIQTNELIDLGTLGQAAHCLRTLAHPHRLRMVQMLLDGEYTVGELADACGIPSNMASEHLCRMKDRGLLSGRREGRRIYYEVAEPGLEGIMSCIKSRFDEVRRAHWVLDLRVARVSASTLESRGRGHSSFCGDL